MSAIRLAEESNWKGLKDLLEEDPSVAYEVDDYGMLPLHWACTEPTVSEDLVNALLQANPEAASTANSGNLLPLHIAIKADATIHWIEALLVSYPEAVLKLTPTGDNALSLAKQLQVSDDIIRLLQDMEEYIRPLKRSISGELNPSQNKPSKINSLQRSISMGKNRNDIIPIDFGSQSFTNGTQSRSQSNGKELSLIPKQNDRINAAAQLRKQFSNLSENPMNDIKIETIPGVGPSSTTKMKPRKSKQKPVADWSQKTATNTSVPATRNSSGNGSISSNPSEKPLPFQTSKRLSNRTVVSLPPRWMNSVNCHICAAKFGTFRKRHHCRNCGQSICKDHSARHRLPLPHFGIMEKQRVCTLCFDKISTADQSELEPSSSSPTTHQRQEQSISIESIEVPSMDSSNESEKKEKDPVRLEMEEKVLKLQEQVNLLLAEKELEKKEEAERQTRHDFRRMLSNASSSANSDEFHISSDQGSRSLPARTSSIIDSTNVLRLDDLGSTNDENEYDAFARYVQGAPTPSGDNTSDFYDDTRMTRVEDGESSSNDSKKKQNDIADESTDYMDDDDDDESEEEEVDLATLIHLGTTLLEKGRVNGAIAAFQRATKQAPTDGLLYNFLGKALYQDDDLEGAVKALNTSLNLLPSATTSTLLGKILFELGDHDGAIKAYQRSLDMQNPTDEDKG